MIFSILSMKLHIMQVIALGNRVNIDSFFLIFFTFIFYGFCAFCLND